MDFSPSAMKALRYALELGGRNHGTVTVLHALENLDPLTREYSEEAERAGHDVSDHDRQVRQLGTQRQEQLRRLIAAEPRTSREIREVVEVNRGAAVWLQHAACPARGDVSCPDRPRLVR